MADHVDGVTTAAGCAVRTFKPCADRRILLSSCTYQHVFKVEITTRSTDDGGRLAPILTGYRPAFWLDRRMSGSRRAYTDAAIELMGCEQLAPGSSGLALLRPFRPEQWEHLAVGDAVDFYEGARLIGTATIMEKL